MGTTNNTDNKQKTNMAVVNKGTFLPRNVAKGVSKEDLDEAQKLAEAEAKEETLKASTNKPGFGKEMPAQEE